jgi:2-oxoglutarate dehydrogenase E2 component (dihydrolipoamide succinyltransferase)
MPAAPAPATKPVAPPPGFAPPPISPSVRRMSEEQGINVTGMTGTGKDGRLTKGDLMGATKVATPAPSAATVPSVKTPAAPTPLPQAKMAFSSAVTTREPMSKLRQTIARRLVEAQHTAAILTTFNEIDMTAVMALRAKYKEKFKERYNINLGFMGFFTKAAVEALKAFPRVNGMIDGNDLVFNNFVNIGIAVGTEKGLVVPVVKNAEHLSIAEIEMSIKHYAEKARDGKISLDDMSGGTFTISNGGVYGSLMSTPILNPPQSGILGLHKIEERPIAIQGKVEIRPMMYVALSYDHRIIDGGESVSFLVKIKEGMEDPARLLLEI